MIESLTNKIKTCQDDIIPSQHHNSSLFFKLPKAYPFIHINFFDSSRMILRLNFSYLFSIDNQYQRFTSRNDREHSHKFKGYPPDNQT